MALEDDIGKPVLIQIPKLLSGVGAVSGDIHGCARPFSRREIFNTISSMMSFSLLFLLRER
jgi:hypothetical protein